MGPLVADMHVLYVESTNKVNQLYMLIIFRFNASIQLNRFVVPTGVHNLHQDRPERHLKNELFSFSGRVRFCVTLEITSILYIIFSVSPHTTLKETK